MTIKKGDKAKMDDYEINEIEKQDRRQNNNNVRKSKEIEDLKKKTTVKTLMGTKTLLQSEP